MSILQKIQNQIPRNFKREQIAFYIFLLVAILSVQPFPLSNYAINNTIHPPIPEVYACLARLIPENATVLYFNDTDGMVNINDYMGEFINAQYYLVPRVFTYNKTTGKNKFTDFEWYVGENKDIQSLLGYFKANPAIQLGQIGICESKVVFRKKR